MKKTLDRNALIQKLERILHEKDEKRLDDPTSQQNMSRSIPTIAGLDHEKEYIICRAVTEHLLGKVPEPEDVDFES